MVAIGVKKINRDNIRTRYDEQRITKHLLLAILRGMSDEGGELFGGGNNGVLWLLLLLVLLVVVLLVVVVLLLLLLLLQT